MTKHLHSVATVAAVALVGVATSAQAFVGGPAIAGAVRALSPQDTSVGALAVPARAVGRTASPTAGVVLVDVVTQQGEGAGTGMVIDASGLVLTNYHVVEGSLQVRVTVADSGDAYTAIVVGHDATHDVALLRLEGAGNLQTVRLDTADPAQGGDAVTAIGNGGGTGVLQTVTGVVQATGRDIKVADESTPWGSESLTGLIESDVAIVPGYSGGPLFDTDGEVVGINTAGSTNSRVVDAYAIPIQTALAVVDVIEQGASSGTTQVGPSAALGISVPATPAPSRRQSGAVSRGGVVVADVTSGGGADQAGITVGDTITALAGTPTATQSALAQVLSQHRPGDVVAVALVDASGTTRTVQVTLQASPVN